ncbi:ATP-dependent helicase [Mucilaginibacter sp. RS28]|uniref:DNA 3'-5' helicase n=1 Tax=Mucilaginibacter straminoryzae TaxID=2932774 RepID=A0A9X2B9M4_9SPHI|nr:ATP-dependent DNA helicase [Mucilaginibacter straminoryzae]MCJ8210794.1 ATP-dependent helicase [Mucilaginibacter straminoryzae]
MKQNLAEKYLAKFQEIMSGLNSEQLAAVNKIDGPVMVVAGPGTGKTQILAARIGKILIDTDARPEEILCLTYTDAGAVAMRKRLFDFIGPDAYRIHIHTFHAFCNEVIQENLEYFGKLNLEPLTDLESAMLFRELIDEFPDNHALKRFTGDVYFEASRLKSLFSAMKKENWDMPMIEKAVNEYIDDLPNREEFIYKKGIPSKGIQKGDLKQKDIDAAKEVMKKLLAAVAEYSNFERKMKERNRYDYDDMIMWVLRAFRENEEILRRYQERYQYILVDEFQDTSGAQNELLKYLLSYWESPNVFVVGDDDQSIYRFQGANMKNILDFAGDYSDVLHTVILRNNYRSNQSILDISRTLIDNNRERLTKQLNLDKNLVASHPRFNELSADPVILEYDNPDHELVDVGNRIEQLVREGVEPNEIAVIYRNHNQAEELIHYLDMRKIAVNTKRKINIFELPFGEKIINILRYLSLELDSPYSGDNLLFEIMHYDFFEIKPVDVARASIAVSKANYGDSVKTSLRQHISELALPKQPGLFDAVHNAEMKQLVTDIEALLKVAVSLNLQQLFQQVIVKMGILAYVMKQPDKGWHMEVLTNLFNFIKDEAHRNPAAKLRDIIATIELMKRNGIRLDLNQVIYAANGINFLTAHGSKGLEFEHVFLIGCNKKVWDTKGRSSSYAYPDTLMQASADDIAQREESRRLFYVALTRAKQHLYISYPAKDRNGKDLESSQFVGEILAETNLQVQHPHVNSESLLNYFATQFTEEDKPVLDLLDNNYINILLQNYTLSVSHLNNYLDCPLKFYFQNLICVPSGLSPAAAFGSAVHHALNRLFRKLKDNNNEFMPLDDFMKEFRWYMYRNRDLFTEEEFKRRLSYGDLILPAYYEWNLPTWNKVAVTERSIRNVVIEGVPVKGNIDKIEFNGNQVTVVDYKTGKLKNAKDKLRRPEFEGDTGGDYWRQGVFYKLLVDNDRTNDWQAVSAVFEFIEPKDDGDYHHEKYVISPEETRHVTDQIVNTYRKIMNHEFNTGCGKADCQWCHFVRTNFKQPGNIMEVSEEG